MNSGRLIARASSNHGDRLLRLLKSATEAPLHGVAVERVTARDTDETDMRLKQRIVRILLEEIVIMSKKPPPRPTTVARAARSPLGVIRLL